MYKLVVALRYLTRNWLTLVGVAAVAIAVMVLICVLSVMKGFHQELQARIRATVSDLIVESWGSDSFKGYEELMPKIENLPHVVACAPHFEGLALIRIRKQFEYGLSGRVDVTRYGQLHGIDLSRELQTTDFGHYWRAWRGKESREELEQLFDADSTRDSLPDETVADCLRRLRREDFDLLVSVHKKAIRTWARSQRFDLEAAFAKAESSVPEWGSIRDSRESPVFPGVELLVLAQDTDGRRFGVGVGDRLVLMSVADVLTSLPDATVIKRCRIVGAFKSGQPDYDSQSVYLPLADVQAFMGKDDPPQVTSINIRLDSFENAPEVRAALLGILTPAEIEEGLRLVRPALKSTHPERLRKIEKNLQELREHGADWFAVRDSRLIRLTLEAEAALYGAIRVVLRDADGSGLGEKRKEKLLTFRKMTIAREEHAIGHRYRISTWEDKRRTFLRAVWLERRIMAFILFFTILLAGFLILSILHTCVLTKMKDIGILKAIGASVGGIMAVFLLNGLLIGLIGSALGIAGALLFTSNINRIEQLLARVLGFQLFPPQVYYLDRIPVDQQPFWGLVMISSIVAAVSLLASAYPAWKASRMDSVEALRYE